MLNFFFFLLSFTLSFFFSFLPLSFFVSFFLPFSSHVSLSSLLRSSSSHPHPRLILPPSFLLPHLPPSPSISCPLSLPPRLSLAPSLLSLSAVQHSDYHSSHRVRPDSQILLSTLLHHLLLEGGTEREGGGEKENETEERTGRV